MQKSKRMDGLHTFFSVIVWRRRVELLLPFSEYCELSYYIEQEGRNCFIKTKPSRLTGFYSETDLNALRAKALFIADPCQVNVISRLISECNQEMIVELMDYFDKAAPIQQLLEQRLNELDKENQKSIENVFIEEKKHTYIYDILIEKMTEKSYESDAALYTYIGMDRRTFAKFRKKDATISRESALWLTVGFELNYPEGKDFFGKLGYAFKQTDDREKLITQVMRTQKYKFKEMQSILYSFGFRMFGEVN